MRGKTASAAHLSYSARYPVILPAGHVVTQLICDWYHRLCAHGHANQALNELRQCFVMASPRREMNRTMRKCQRCQLRRTRPINPEMAALPISRLAFHRRAFSYCGADLFGPITVCVGRRHEKRWGVLFTCLTTRAIYLEIVGSLSAESVMMAMDSLAARRGPPIQFSSDCGTNFVGAWERLIGVTKRVLERTEMEKTPTEERLRWFLCRAELLVNSRPLTDVPADPESNAAITPNDLLIGSSSGQKPDITAKEKEDLMEFLSLRDEDIQSFWKRWTVEYLPMIACRSKWRRKETPIAVGDVVYLCDGDYRYGWRKGVVEQVHVDVEAEQVRQVVVRTADGSKYRRGATGVAPITWGIEREME